MKDFVAIVKTSGNTLEKFQDFATQAEADAHVASFGGWVAPNPGGDTRKYWVIDAAAETIGYDQPAQDIAQLEMAKDSKYKEANREFVPRSLAAAETAVTGSGNLRGSSPEQRLTALGVKANARGGTALKNALADTHDKVETLKDTIEAAVDQAAVDAIDTTADGHWS